MSDEQPTPVLRKILPFTSAAMVIALIYIGYIFYSRHEDQKQAEQQASAKQAEANERVSELYGGQSLKILDFHATAGAVHAGETAQLCYGVSNAEKITIEPEVHEVPSSYSNCAKIAPKKDTTYTLTATDKKGNTQQAVLTIHID